MSFQRIINPYHVYVPEAAKAAGMEWVTIETYNEEGTEVEDRAINLARYSETSAASKWRAPRRASRPGDCVGVTLAERD